MFADRGVSQAEPAIKGRVTIRQLEEGTKRKLRIRAAQHGRSMEQEAREILKTALNRPKHQPKAPVAGKSGNWWNPSAAWNCKYLGSQSQRARLSNPE